MSSILSIPFLFPSYYSFVDSPKRSDLNRFPFSFCSFRELTQGDVGAVDVHSSSLSLPLLSESLFTAKTFSDGKIEGDLIN